MKIFVTRKIPESGLALLREKGYEVIVNPDDRVLGKQELIAILLKDSFDALLCLLTDTIDDEVIASAHKSGVKIIANYAVGFDNIAVAAANKLGIVVTNTPDVLTKSVAEHTLALMLAIAHRIPEADRFTRAGKYHGWEPMLLLGTDLSNKTLGVVGLGRVGASVVRSAVRGFGMRALYHDIKRDETFEKETGATFRENADDIFKESDFISIHTPLLPSTRHLVDARRLSLMKQSSYLINTSRGPIIDEVALVEVLRTKRIAGAALDVFEHEPALAPGLVDLDNVILTPHIASATNETRNAMSELAAKNIIEILEGRSALTSV